MQLHRRAIYLMLFLAFSISLAGCAPRFPTAQRAYPVPVNMQMWRNGFVPFALSPDGQFVIYGSSGWIRLNTGEETRPLANYAITPEGYMGISQNMGWSPDGRYFAVTTFYDERSPGANRLPIYIFDSQTLIGSKIEGDVGNFQMWSPFNNGRYMAEFYPEGWSVFDVQGSAPISLHEAIDFRQEQEVGGSGWFLWSKRLDVPVAWIAPVPVLDEEGQRTGASQLFVDSFSYPMDYQNPTYRVSVAENPPLDNLIEAIFDPTGEYILLVQWGCSDSSLVHCSNDPSSFDTNNVTDTVLTLIRWRTGEKHELFRLSQIDPQNVVGSAPVVWSADGSTIVLGRYDASAVVIKVKYP